MSNHLGFTLIELMIVVAIIAILVAIAIPNYQLYIMRTQLVRAYGELNTLKTSVEVCEADGNIGVECELTSLNSSIYLASPSVTYNPSEISANFSDKVYAPLQGGSVKLERGEIGGWKCTMTFSNDVPTYVIPKPCRNND